MNNFEYTLEPGSKKHHCPECGKKTFVFYVDTETGENLPTEFGRCDRELKCGYHLNPYKAGYKPDDYTGSLPQKGTPRPPMKPSLISAETMQQSLKGYSQNNFTTWLKSIFDLDTVNRLINTYQIGTSKHWPGAVVFWQVDKKGSIRTGKIMLYDATTGKRVKEPFNHIFWAHKAIEPENFNLKQCFFGEHLLSDAGKPVAVVESEKAAIVGAAFFPEMVWLATGGLTNLNAEKCRVLAGRNVTFFPDAGAFEKWKEKVSEVAGMIPGTFIVSDLLEVNTTEKQKVEGLDIADFLIKLNPGQMTANSETGLSAKIVQKSEPGPWNIDGYVSFFNNVKLPGIPVELAPGDQIADHITFITSTIEELERNNGNPAFEPLLKRLHEYYEIIAQYNRIERQISLSTAA